MKYLLIFLFISCNFEQEPIEIETSEDLKSRQVARDLAKQKELERKKQLFLKEKSKQWEKIVLEAKDSYKDISKLIERKCSDCHNEYKKLPIYGRVLPRLNPVFKHQKEGLEALDLSRVFPLRTSDGYKPQQKENVPKIDTNLQISFLKAFRDSVTKRTMPLRSYTIIYRSKRIFNNDESEILAWIDPLIQRITTFQDKYEKVEEQSTKDVVRRILSSKCIRCHGNGNAKGGFADIEKLDNLLKSKYINLDDPLSSELLESVVSGYMPINPSDKLSAEEISYIQDWLVENAN